MKEKKTKGYVERMLYLAMCKRMFDVIDTYQAEVIFKMFEDFYALVKDDLEPGDYANGIEIQDIEVLNTLLKIRKPFD